MNKTITVNISGLIFNIEEQAYEKLGRYLSAIRRYFAGTEGGEEIMSDIESRVAELFQEKITPQKQVINVPDVNGVIETMGQPEEYAEADPEMEEEKTRPPKEASSSRRRIFRDPDNRVLGGVCSGISAYFGWDPIILRVLFVVLLITAGVGIIPYLILWIIIPKARTTAEKLEMRGEPVTVDNIGKSVSDSFNDVKEGFDRYTRNPGKVRETGAYRNARSGAHSGLHFIGHLATLFLKALVAILGFLLIISGISGLLFIIGAAFGSTIALDFADTEGIGAIWQFSNLIFNSDLQFNLLSIGIILLTAVPMVAFIYIGIRILFKTRGRDLIVAIILAVFWLTGLGFTIFSGLNLATDFNSKSDSSEIYNLALNTDTLHLSSMEAAAGTFSMKFEDEDEDEFDMEGFDIQLKGVNLKNDSILAPSLDVDVEQNYNSDQIQLRVNRKARGSSNNEARKRAHHINFRFSVEDSSRLLIAPDISYPASDKIRLQNVDMTVLLPLGKSIFLEPKSERIIYDIENVTNTWDGDMLGHTWQMRREGLTCLDCPGWENHNSHNGE